MTPRLFRFSMTALAGTVIVASVLAVAYRNIAIEDLEDLRASQNSEIALSLAASARDDIDRLLALAAAGSDLADTDVVGRLGAAYDEKIEDLSVRKINIFAPDGTKIFSTEPEQIGTAHADSPGVEGALAGNTVSDIVRRDELNAFDQVVERLDLIQTYVPLRSDSGEIVGVFEIYSDVTPLLLHIAETQFIIVAGVFGTMGGFYLLLVWMFRRTDRQLAAEQAAREAHLKEVEQARDELEDRVAERTRFLQRERDMMQRAIDGLKDPAIVADKDHNVVIMNKAAREAYADRIAGDAGVFCHKLLHGLDAPCDDTEAPCALTSGEACKKILDGTDGTPVEFRATPLIDDRGDVAAVVEVMHDLNEHEQTALRLRHEKEVAESASEVKSEFVATISHEIRTPMNAVLGMTDLLKLTNLTRKQRSYIQTIQSSGEMLLSLVDNVLDFSRLEAEALTLHETEFPVVDLVENVLRVMGYPAGSKGLELIGSIHDDLDLRVVADKRRLRQILVNLVGNAIKFTERGEITIDVTLRDEHDGEGQLCFSVSDTGTGIDETTREKLFTPFASSPRPASSQQYGSGLGLTICKKLIDSMGGTIEVSDRASGGTRVEFCIPVACVRPTNGSRMEPDRANLPQRVLTAHANGVAAANIDDRLRRWGVDNECVYDAAEALQRIELAAAEGRPYDAVIIDSALTPTDNLLLMRRIRGEEEIALTPAVLLTSITEPLEVGEVSSLGRLRCINKPVLPLELRYHLLRLLQEEQQVLPDGDREPLPEARAALRILIAEDNPVNRTLLLGMLRSEGYDADVVEDGPSVLEKLEKDSYDLVLMDCQMPGLDGDDVTREIRRQPDRYTQPPVIVAVTADTTERHRAQCLAAGMDDFIPKPVRLEKLRAGLARWASMVAQRGGGEGDAGEAEVLRQALIDRTGQSDGSFLGEYIGLFLADTESRLSKLERAVDARDAEKIRREGHALKGTCLEFGAERMVRYCEELAAAARSDNLDAAGDVLDRMAREFARLKPVFESASAAGLH